jgi:hypothetical protein
MTGRKGDYLGNGEMIWRPDMAAPWIGVYLEQDSTEPPPWIGTRWWVQVWVHGVKEFEQVFNSYEYPTAKACFEHRKREAMKRVAERALEIDR